LLLEKPISHTFEGIDRLLDAVVKGGSSVLVGYQFRFHPGLRRLADLLAEGAIGRPLSFRAHWGEYLPGWHPWEDYRQGYSARPDLGGGVILTLSHPLDYARWLLGEVEAVWAFASRESDLALLVEDTAEIGMRFASGAIGSIHLNYTQQPPAHHLEIIGSEGTLRWDNMHGSTRLFRAGGESWESFPLPDDFSRNTLFLTEMRHFLDMVRVNAQPACTLEDGIQALMLAEAALESARTGQLITL
jgi:predicted dehydrogenase